MSKSPSASAAEGFTFWKKEESSVETRVAVLAIIVRDTASVPALNELLHQYHPDAISRDRKLLRYIGDRWCMVVVSSCREMLG